jgi:YebC/PmpR family DNA-binding regulatory protein
MLPATLLLATLIVGESWRLSCPPARSAVTPHARCGSVSMGRKFENNKMKMAKTALANAKKASYIGKKVVIAVKAGGGDPSVNRQLAAIMREANAMDVTKDVVDRNIKRAMSQDTANFKDMVYETYGHGGIGIIVSCLSDNSNRASSEVGTVVKKGSCKMAAQGSVLFNFERKGRLSLTEKIDEDALLELAIEAGCDGDVSVQPPDPDMRHDDVEKVKCVVLTEPTELGLVQEALQAEGKECSGMLVHVPVTMVECSEEDKELNFDVIDKLDELDDVAFVEHNMVMS